jgi:hypothetical protein
MDHIHLRTSHSLQDILHASATLSMLPAFPISERLHDRIRGWVRSKIIEAGAYDEDGFLREERYFLSMFCLCHHTFKGAKALYGKDIPEEVANRLKEELKTIFKEGCPDYFLILQDCVAWARKKRIVRKAESEYVNECLVVHCLGLEGVGFDKQGRILVLAYLEGKYGMNLSRLIRTAGWLEDTWADEADTIPRNRG